MPTAQSFTKNAGEQIFNARFHRSPERNAVNENLIKYTYICVYDNQEHLDKGQHNFDRDADAHGIAHEPRAAYSRNEEARLINKIKASSLFLPLDHESATRAGDISQA